VSLRKKHFFVSLLFPSVQRKILFYFYVFKKSLGFR
jgi:hypothetical protein